MLKILHSEFKFSLDRLTIVGYDSGTFADTINDPFFEYIAGSTFPDKRYRKAWKCTDGSHLQWTDLQNLRPIRFEFNPNNIIPSPSNEHRQNVVKILTTMKYPKINRMDLAFDIKGIDLNDYQVIDNIGRKYRIFYDATGRTETHYIGGQQAPMQIRIYDKAKEQGKQSEGHWWRIEAQLKKEWTTLYHDLGQVPNPFEGLILVRKDQPFEDFPYKERLVLLDLLKNPENFSQLDKRNRLKYKKILSSQKETEKDINLNSLFESTKTQIEKELKYWLQFSKNQNVI